MGVLVGYRVKQVTQGLNGEIINFLRVLYKLIVLLLNFPGEYKKLETDLSSC